MYELKMPEELLLFLINEQRITGAQTFETFQKVIEEQS